MDTIGDPLPNEAFVLSLNEQVCVDTIGDPLPNEAVALSLIEQVCVDTIGDPLPNDARYEFPLDPVRLGR